MSRFQHYHTPRHRLATPATWAKRTSPTSRKCPSAAGRPAYSLAAADCTSVCMDEGYQGLSVPSKTYYAIGASGAQVAVSHPSTQLTALVEGHGCGVRAPPSRPGLLTGIVWRLHSSRPMLEQ